jgi:hypothetical protein
MLSLFEKTVSKSGDFASKSVKTRCSSHPFRRSSVSSTGSGLRFCPPESATVLPLQTFTGDTTAREQTDAHSPTGGNVFGGFRPLEWESDEDWKCKYDDSQKSFLFILKNPHQTSRGNSHSVPNFALIPF